MASAEAEVLKVLEDIKRSVRELHSKIDNFEGFFEASEDDVKEYVEEVKRAKKEGVRLEDLE
jgi:DNA-binding PadR family transcriptional regulator